MFTVCDKIVLSSAMTPASMNTADSVRKLTCFLERDTNVIFAVLFGSGAAGTMKKDSDIDIGIFFKVPPEGLDFLGLISSLSDLAGKDVDVVVLNRSSAFLKHQVMKTKINLIIKDEDEFRKFREKTISDFDEYKYVSGMSVYDR